MATKFCLQRASAAHTFCSGSICADYWMLWSYSVQTFHLIENCCAQSMTLTSSPSLSLGLVTHWISGQSTLLQSGCICIIMHDLHNLIYQILIFFCCLFQFQSPFNFNEHDRILLYLLSRYGLLKYMEFNISLESWLCWTLIFFGHQSLNIWASRLHHLISLSRRYYTTKA